MDLPHLSRTSSAYFRVVLSEFHSVSNSPRNQISYTKPLSTLDKNVLGVEDDNNQLQIVFDPLNLVSPH